MENIVGLCDMKLEMYGLENHLGKTMPCSIFYHSINAYFFFPLHHRWSLLSRMILILLELPFVTSEMCN